MNKYVVMMAVLSMVAMMAVTVEAQFVDTNAVAKSAATVTSVVPVAVVSTTAAANEDRFSVGVYGGYRTGGDTATPSMAIGVNGVYSATEHISFEASVVKVQDDMDLTTMRMTQFGFMPRLEAQVLENTRLYGGIGILYTIFEVDLGTPGFSAKIEPSVGVLAAVGISYQISKRVSISIDVRFASSETTAVVDGPCDYQAVVGGGVDDIKLGGSVDIAF